MSLKTKLSIFLTFYCFFTVELLTARTVVSTAQEIVDSISYLSDGDTLYIAPGYYEIGEELVSSGVTVAQNDWMPYDGLTILGAGMDETIIDFKEDYGFLVYFSKNVSFEHLTIKNARHNGAIYVYSGSVSLSHVMVDSCHSDSTELKIKGDGGALYIDNASSIVSITDCVFSNNIAKHRGGAIANMSALSGGSMTIARNKFYNNQASEYGAAIYFSYSKRTAYLTSNLAFSNKGSHAFYLNGRYSVYLKNNTVVNNEKAGVYVGSALAERFYFNNNLVVDNETYDCRGVSVNNRFKGNFNVVGNSYRVIFDGYYNRYLTQGEVLYDLDKDSLSITLLGASLLAGRVSSGAFSTYDYYGNTTTAPGDIGAINVPLGDSIAVWIGKTNQEFFNTSNWKVGNLPLSGGSIKKVIVSDCQDNYPIIPSTVETTNGGDFSSIDFYITPTGALDVEGKISVDTLLLESQKGGTSQLLNNGEILSSAKLSEFYMCANIWTPVYISDATLTAEGLLPKRAYGVDYQARSFNESTLSLENLSASDSFSLEQGYFVNSNKKSTITLDLKEVYKESFEIQHTEKGSVDLEGWNMIGNPYDAPVSSKKVFANAGNAGKVAGAIYVFSDGRFKAYVDSVGDRVAEMVSPHAAFFVQALDVDAGTLSDTTDFVINKDDVVITDNNVKNSESVIDGVMLQVSLYDQRDEFLDNAYFRFIEKASDRFDFLLDAYKLDVLARIENERIYTVSGVDDAYYAVNTQDTLSSNSNSSVPLVLDFPSTSFVNSTKRTLKFHKDDNYSYLFHDAEKDSSESVIVFDDLSVEFNIGADSVLLANRFSIQAFNGEVPDSVLQFQSQKATGYMLRSSSKRDAYSKETKIISFFFRQESLLDNPDTVFVLNHFQDSVFLDSILYDVTYNDSIAFDTLFNDTLKVLGTHYYTVHEVSVDSMVYTETDTMFLDTIKRVEWREHTEVDTVLVSALFDDKALAKEYDLVVKNTTVGFRHPSEKAFVATMYDLSGRVVQKRDFLSYGEFDNIAKGFYVLLFEDLNSRSAIKIEVP